MNEQADIPRLPDRPRDSHKGDFGRVVLVGGSVGMSGAISLAGMAALRSGAGLVTICAPGPCVPTIASHEPSYMTAAAAYDIQLGTFAIEAQEQIEKACENASCVGLGPGMGHNPTTSRLTAALYQQIERPMVVDADALNGLASLRTPLKVTAARILTPHPGELRRLLDRSDATIEELRQLVVPFAGTTDCLVLLKGRHTLITDGTRLVTNLTGNSGMSTGGMGDVLTGMITSLIGQGMPPFEATVLAAYLHGLAGDLAAKELGEHSLIASDVVRFLPTAFQIHARKFHAKKFQAKSP